MLPVSEDGCVLDVFALLLGQVLELELSLERSDGLAEVECSVELFDTLLDLVHFLVVFGRLSAY